MRRFRIGIFLSFIVMLTACGDKTDLSEDTELLQAEAYSTEKDSNNGESESAEDDSTDNSDETVQADDEAEDTADVAQLTDDSQDSAETSQPNDSAKTAGNDESDEPDTIYFKSCNTYQDILDNAYEVIIHRGADFVEADETFSYIGIWESVGRDVDEALASIGYTYYDVDGNGIEELIIMDTNEDSDSWNNRILTMYSLVDDKPVLVIDGWARNRYYLLNDGTFYNEGSSSASCTIFATYRVDENGSGLKVIDYYHSDSYGDSEWGWFHNTTGEHTVDERELIEFENDDVPWEMMENYIAQVKELDLTFFETMRQ